MCPPRQSLLSPPWGRLHARVDDTDRCRRNLATGAAACAVNGRAFAAFPRMPPT